jgi:hypothetical protein
LVGGSCWYLGSNNQSCNTVCAAHGAVYDNATSSYAGSAGTLQHCADVLTAIAPPASGTFDSGGCVAGFGCLYQPPFWIRCTNPGTTSAAVWPDVARACACQ